MSKFIEFNKCTGMNTVDSIISQNDRKPLDSVKNLYLFILSLNAHLFLKCLLWFIQTYFHFTVRIFF